MDLLGIALSNLVEILAIMLSSILIEHRFFGRKFSMIIFYFLTAIFSVITYFSQETSIFI